MSNTSSSGSGVDKRPLTCEAPLVPKTLQPLVVDNVLCYLILRALLGQKAHVLSQSTISVDFVPTPSFWDGLVEQLNKAFGKTLTTGSEFITAEQVHEIYKQLVKEKGSTWYKKRTDCWRFNISVHEGLQEVRQMDKSLRALTEEPDDRDTWFKYQNTKWTSSMKAASRDFEKERREGFEDDPVYNVVVPAGAQYWIYSGPLIPKKAGNGN